MLAHLGDHEHLAKRLQKADWTKNRMKDKWSDVLKVEVREKLKSSDELLQDFNTKLLKLQEQGYLKGLKVYGLPEPEDSNDTEAE